MDNYILDPELNSFIFYEVNKTQLAKYYTKDFLYFPFKERRAEWQQDSCYCQIWQTDDIVSGQFLATFDPIIIQLVDEYDNVVIDLPTLAGLPNLDYPGYYMYQYSMSLGTLTTGWYRARRTAGTGSAQRIDYTQLMYISEAQIPNSLLIEYYDTKPFYKDVMFVSGIKFQFRVEGWVNFDGLVKARKDEGYRDEKYNPVILNSKTSKQVPTFFGPQDGIPVDFYNLIDEIFGCNTVTIDGVLYGLPEGNKIEVVREENYRKIGVNALLEYGLNRNSRVFTITGDPNKRLMYAAAVDKKVMGDTSNQGAFNTVPLIVVE